MRLWHKDLISVLPDKHLIAQWRECCAIASNIANKGTPNHLLVNKIMDYKLSHFYKYCMLVAAEMHRRNFKLSDKSIEKIHQISDQNIRMETEFITDYELFSGWHNDRYLTQCYYNLQEKFDCNGITVADWQRITDRMVIEEET